MAAQPMNGMRVISFLATKRNETGSAATTAATSRADWWFGMKIWGCARSTFSPPRVSTSMRQPQRIQRIQRRPIQRTPSPLRSKSIVGSATVPQNVVHSTSQRYRRT